MGGWSTQYLLLLLGSLALAPVRTLPSACPSVRHAKQLLHVLGPCCRRLSSPQLLNK